MTAHAVAIDAVTRRILSEQPFLKRLALRLSRRSPDADDLVQETLLRAYRARERFQRGTSMRAWLATILRRLFLTGAIKAKRRGTQTATDAGDAVSFAAMPDREDTSELTRAQRLEQVDDRLLSALQRVPQVYREPFEMFSLDGLSYADIATRIDVPVGTVMSRIHRARTRIKASLVESGYRAAS